jgi:hypothetical protein
MESIPGRLTECGLHVPSFICFECPIPGTPHFHRLAAEDPPALLPNALLRDFNAYTLVTRPKREPVEGFIETYRTIMKTTYAAPRRIRKLADDLPRFLAGGYWMTSLVDLGACALDAYQPHPDRTYIAGTDVPHPEATSVPLTEDDFSSDAEQRAILEPMRVTDSSGRVLPEWRESTRVFEKKGAVSAGARQLIAVR